MVSTLQEAETKFSIADEICLLKQVKKVPYIIVEGNFDKNTYQKFCNLSKCEIYPANSKNYIIVIFFL